jgi:ABC-2 type transport system permease protein
MVTALLVTPMAFLGGGFYSISALPDFWRKVSLFDPVVYAVNQFRWSFFNIADVTVLVSCGATVVLSVVTFVAAMYMFKIGFRLKT